MGQIQCFDNPLFGRIRVIERAGDPWFVAKDVCECLGLEQVSRACDKLDDDERVLLKVTHPQNPQKELEVCGISESGLYALVMRSNKPEAKGFRKWVTAEVLPSIRKTGAYSIAPKTYVEALRALANEIEQKELAEAQRDEAIRTKAQIGTRREATAMNTASQKSRECERLREQIGNAQHWKQVKAIRWLPQYFALSKGLYGAIAHKLKEICMDNGWERRDIPDTEYGTVKAYPIDAIEILHKRIEADANMLGRYRLP